jgi:serine/threonine-protein kinase RsbW
MEPLIVSGNMDALSQIRSYVREVAKRAGVQTQATYRLCLAVDEIATNIVTHGYEEAGVQGDIIVSAQMDNTMLTITLEDEAQPFDPRLLQDPEDLEKSLEERKLGGLGVWIMLREVDRFDYDYVNKRNCNRCSVKRTKEEQ